MSHLPGSLAAAVIGIVVGQIYRSDLANLKSYRISPATVRFGERFLIPLIGSTRAPRRSNRALPDDLRMTSGPSNAGTASEPTDNGNDEVITTARSSTSSGETPGHSPEGGASGTSVVREWVNELTGRTDRANAGIRAPSEGEIAQLTNMFPDFERDVIAAALQRR